MTIYRGPGGTGSATSDADTTQFQEFLVQSQAARDAAVVAKVAAETAETNAETAEVNAETAQTNAAVSASSAVTSANNAAASAVSSASSAASSSSSASDAATSASSAAASASEAVTTLASTVKLTGAQTISGTKTFSASQIINVTDNTNAALRVTQLGTGDSLVVEDSTNPDSTPFVINNAGTVVSGYGTSVVTAGSAVAPRLQVHGLGGGSASAGVTSWSTGGNVGPSLVLSRSEGGVVGTQTLVDANDFLGNIRFAGSDGVAFIEAAKITGEVDGTPGVSDMPGRLVLSTTADGASSPTERVRVNSSGAVGFAGANFGATGQMLMSQGPTASPVWAAVDALPSQTGNSGKYLTTNGTVASWNALNTDANTTTKGLYENNSVISVDYSITAGNNALSSGPVSVNSGITVTVPSGSRCLVI